MRFGVSYTDVQLKVSNKILQHLNSLVNFNFNDIEDRVCHRFPNPKTDMHRLKAWVNIIFEGEELRDTMATIYYNKFVCDRHFTSDCTSTGTNRLKKNSYPTTIHIRHNGVKVCALIILFSCVI